MGTPEKAPQENKSPQSNVFGQRRSGVFVFYKV